MLSDISPEIINNYARFLRNTKRIGETTLNMMMSRTRTIINRGIKKQLVKYDISPFAYYSIKGSPIREVDITIQNLIKIKNYTPKEKKLRVARDLFMLSFYLGGINLADLLNLDFRKTEVIDYIRKKARNLKQGEQRIIIPIPEAAKSIIKEWINKNTGKLDFGYKFTYSNFYRYLTRNINEMADILDINQKVVYYSARKTFAQFASELGIPDGVIDYCLGHSDKNRGIIRYYTKVKQKQAEIAINRVIDYVNNPEKYKDYQYVHVFFEGKILCCCQCHSRSSDTLNSRVICQVYKKNSTVYRSGFLKALYKEVGLLESNTHGSKYNRKLLIFSTNLRLSCDLCRKLCMRKTGC